MSSLDHDSADDPRVAQAARDYLAELEAGRTPGRSVYLYRYPELADAVAECLDGVEMAHALAKGDGGRGKADQIGSPFPRPPSAFQAEPLGDFKIVREVGRGGMGVVYEAVQLSLGRRVALKVLPFAAALDAKHLQRFKTEAHAAAQLHHSNIVPVYAVGCERGVHFYAMQLIDGRPLDVVIKEFRGEPLAPGRGNTTTEYRAVSTAPMATAPLTGATRSGRGRDTYRTAATLIAQVADALDYAHDAGVVHRDIKPANLLLDAKGAVWVTDFGLAQVSADAGLTRTGDVFGTLRYSSPEQAAGKRVLVDHRTDIYSLGATLYELLTLEPIFPGQDRQSLLHEILTAEPTPPRQHDRNIPVDLETVVLKAVAKTPTERYATAGELAADLRRFLAEQPIRARRPSLADRGRKWLRRHPSVVVATVVVLALGVVGLGAAAARVAQEKTHTEEALLREKQRAVEAEQRFQMARRSVDELIKLGEEGFAEGPQFEGLRRQLLETAIAFYQEFIEQRKDDPDAAEELAATRDRVKKLLSDLTVIQGKGTFDLLRDPGVLADLRATPDQLKQLTVFRKRTDEQRPDKLSEFHRFTKDERQARLVELARATETEVANILTPEQYRRLEQIALQVQGPKVFREPKVIAALGLTADQKGLVQVVEAEFFGFKGDGPWGGPKGDGPPRGGPKDDGHRGGFRKKGLGVATDRFIARLTPEQQAKWRALVGVPYTEQPFSGPPPRPFDGP